MIRTLKALWGRVSGWWERADWVVFNFLFPNRYHYKPSMVHIFTYNDVEYYTYESIREIPYGVLRQLSALLPVLNGGYVKSEYVVGAARAVLSELGKPSPAVGRIVEVMNSLQDWCGVNYDVEAHVQVLKLLLFTKNGEGYKNISERCIGEGFIDFVMKAGVLLGLNDIVLNTDEFREYFNLQAEYLERIYETCGIKADESLALIKGLRDEVYKAKV